MTSPAHFPVFIDMRARLAVIVGSGPLAEKRARTLAKHGADVVMLAPEPTEALRRMEAEGLLTIEERDWQAEDLANATIVVCASEDPEVRRAVYREAGVRAKLVISGDPDTGNLVLPSVIQRGRLQIAVSTSGASPEIARRAKREISERIGPAWEDFTELNAIVRGMVHERVAEPERRARLLDALAADDSLLERLADGETVDPKVVFELLEREGA